MFAPDILECSRITLAQDHFSSSTSPAILSNPVHLIRELEPAFKTLPTGAAEGGLAYCNQQAFKVSFHELDHCLQVRRF